VWPVPTWRDRAPLCSDGFGSKRPGGIRHGGVDVMFVRVPADPYKPGTPNATRMFVMPDGLVAVAASDGLVWSAMETPRGFAVTIDHTPRKVTTFYTHLERLLVAPTTNAKSGEHVKAGQPIGMIGADPLDGEHLKHLHFELWFGGAKDRVDPAPYLQQWDMVPAPSSTAVARNAALVYRPVGASGEPYPAWVRALDGKAGVYVIREIETREVVYVGSSVGRLYDTLTRHFATWRRFKRFWKGQYGAGHDPGLTYERHTVDVAVRVTSSATAFDEEMRLIRRLKPRDNLVGQPTDNDTPF
jgi:hypothetical protein